MVDDFSAQAPDLVHPLEPPMPWPIRLTTKEEFYRARDQWRDAGCPHPCPLIGLAYEVDLGQYFTPSPDYTANRQGRLPRIVAMPALWDGGKLGYETFNLDAAHPQADGGRPHSWTVIGELPNIAVTPSINLVGRWHGFIGVNGVQIGYIGDDVEGRRFNA